MWRRLLESTSRPHDTIYSVRIVDAPQTLNINGKTRQHAVSFDRVEEFDLYWVAGHVPHKADLTVYCIDYTARNWNFAALLATEGPKILHVYNFDSDAYDPHAEYIQQYLRLVCLDAGAALAYEPDWLLLLRSELGRAQHPHNVVSRIVVPSGWDSPTKISTINEKFPIDKHWSVLEVPQVEIIDVPHAAAVEPIEFERVLDAVRNKGDNRQELGNVLKGLLDKAST